MKRTEPTDAPVLTQTPETIYEKIEGIPLLSETLETVSCMTFVVGRNRRIVHANSAFLRFLGYDEPASVLGKRVGEALTCLHAVTSEKGCGSTVFCRYCGVTCAGNAAAKEGAAVRELRMLRRSDLRLGAVDLRVAARRIELDGKEYAFYALDDISDEKRREQLERTFFHDLLNSVNVVQSLAWAMRHGEADDDYPVMLEDSTRQIVEEIKVQRMLSRAESGDLVAELAPLDVVALLEEMARVYRSHVLAREREVLVVAPEAHLVARTDPVLLRRVVGNLVKNALEAAEKGETVTLECREAAGRVRIEIRNPAVIPDEVKYQIFNRSFSTKGEGRGIGTYSVKLLTERYLEGEVGFETKPEVGTVFHVVLPLAAGRTRGSPLRSGRIEESSRSP